MILVKKKSSPTPHRPTTGSQPARRQRGTKEATRERLIEAAIKVIRKRGVEALSTVSVTKAAGFAQSSFYMHFKNVDDCLRAAAEKVAGEARAFIAGHRRRTHEVAAADPAASLLHLQAVLRLFVEQRSFAELLVRHRHDRSPLGRMFRKMQDGVRADLIADSWHFAESLGVHRRHYDRVALQAEFIHANVMAAGEALLAGRYTDADLLAAELSATVEATIQASLARCLADG
ncbi:MAG: TetR/AcrR family transcriptional regulator [Chthoniobacteraceae bacterium]